MTWRVPSDLRHPEPVPDHADPSTWRQCLAVGCMAKVDPWAHHFRCDEHRRPVDLDARHVAFVTGAGVRQAVADETLYDLDYPARLLDAIIADAPNLVARVMLQLQRAAR